VKTLAAVGLALLTLVALAGPAAAHTGTVIATNTRSEIVKTVDIPGISVRLTDLAGGVEVINGSGHEVIVLGYQGEPYFRIASDGVFENKLSPAGAINSSGSVNVTVNNDIAKQAPQWVLRDTGHSVTWRDHRTHWMGSGKPIDRVTPWELPLRIDGQPVTVKGQIVYVPGPVTWPWLVGAVALAVLVVVLARSRANLVFRIAIAGVVVLDIVRIIGLKPGLTGALVDIVGWLLGVVTMWRLSEERHDGPLAAGVTGLLLAIVGGILEWSDIGSSQLAVSTPDVLHRACVAGVAGLGVGVAIAALLETGRVPIKRVATPRAS